MNSLSVFLTQTSLMSRCVPGLTGRVVTPPVGAVGVGVGVVVVPPPWVGVVGVVVGVTVGVAVLDSPWKRLDQLIYRHELPAVLKHRSPVLRRPAIKAFKIVPDTGRVTADDQASTLIPAGNFRHVEF